MKLFFSMWYLREILFSCSITIDPIAFKIQLYGYSYNTGDYSYIDIEV